MIIVRLKIGYSETEFNCATAEEFEETAKLLIKFHKAFDVSYEGEEEADE